MYIYILTNKVNGKQYVGQSINDPEGSRGRLRQHFRSADAGRSAIDSAIKKHGKENFEYEVLNYKGASIEALNAIEVWKIKQYDTLRPNGYNLTTGGKNGGSVSDEVKKKISKAHKGRVVSQETRDKLSKSLKGKCAGEKKPPLGKTEKR